MTEEYLDRLLLSCACILLAGLQLTSCAGPEPAGPSSAELRLLTWNILHGADSSGEMNLEEKGHYLAADPAQVVFLQEVDRECERTRGVDQMAVLARLTGKTPAFGSFMPFQGGEYGMGMLSSLPIESTKSIRLPDGNEPRVALTMGVTLFERPLLLVNVHFNWIRDDAARLAQATALLEALARIDAAVVVAGDYNDIPGSRTLQAFTDAGFRQVDPPGASFSTSQPRVDIDHILIRDGGGLSLEAIEGGVVRTTDLSDHFPVFGRVRISPGV